MARALELARKGAGRTSPNPMVGAVIIKNGRVVGEGYHKKAGFPHGEIEALKKAGSQANGADLYVNLEPCCHFGKTPPCTDAIIAAGIRKVIVGMSDPNKLVRGKGFRKLRQKGIEVVTGVLGQECTRLNEVFVKYICTHRPFVILKTAVSLDGKIATSSGQSQWITGAKARQRVHQIRNEVDAIVAGAGTIVADNPLLTTRLGKKSNVKHPVRVVLDNENLVPLNANVFKNTDSQRVFYIAGKNISVSRKKALIQKGVEVLSLKEKKGKVDLQHLMQTLGEKELTSVLIEGGGEVNASFLEAGLVDKVMVFVAPILIGGRDAPGPVGGNGISRLADALKIKNMTVSSIGNDWLLEGYL
ncbi:MAG: bifunctional diaminohydroxyphosphoribosylaminopyrimidine deaminase/5-amino-6-(5-phosphoribosylamino)uracil reductase RibD [Nitrospinae bacterium]|jgi:diaminohydroxyphosphoribosylaminopyrimidine deaminase / 5-amino-6-(5-phosphoribosylamino)uracil reductase|nr:bifunctional diaminohydroxyphosphoribosylaminopyrimidine deaminase/5-amino-6-(5-phosphoribosylamino)uracil reductase RibD [Nitrospinota bacterium]MDA1109295.1 bifunctional diaminohydroxyphosphoribosylaminopyrimidine deaminase/5-amino-6-(5-phosphoribosylamino)uracil reductase RibD [Nitrospinota bacterium]